MKKIFGFTLLELLVTLSILIIVLGFSISLFHKISNNSIAEDELNKLLRVINYARMLSISSGEKVIVCASQDHKKCDIQWGSGYAIFCSSELNFYLQQNVHVGHFYWRSYPNYLKYLVFTSNGKANFQNGTFWFCLKNQNSPIWAIAINQSGRARKMTTNEAQQLTCI